MQNLKQLLEAGEITQAAYDILKGRVGTIVQGDGEIIPLNTVIFQYYTREHYESNTGKTVSEDDWNELASTTPHYLIDGDGEESMYYISEELGQA